MKQPITQLAVTAFTLALAASGQVLAQQGGGAEIIIEEQPARIQVEQGEPDVVVDQPAPDVQVTKPRPEVEIDQAAPDVKLRDAPAQVEVDDQGQPDITVRQQEPDVQMGERGQPEQEAERITREPDVREREAEETTSPPAIIAGEEPVPAEAGPGMLMSKTVGEVTDMEIVNRTGEEIGDVDRVVQEIGSNRLFAVTSVGGFLGLGATDIAIGLDEMNLRDDQLIAPVVAGEDRLEERYAYDEARFREVSDEVVLGQVASTSGDTTGMTEARQPLPEFSILDADGDGYITQEEAQASPVLRQAFPRVDADNNQRIDRGEFSAFESGTPSP
jgi:hypothetical protein